MLSEQESIIIVKIYDAALQPTLWPEVLQEIVVFTNSKTAIFTALDQLNPNHDFVFTHQIPQVGLDAYQEERIQVIDMQLHVPLWQQAGVGGIVNQDLSHYAHMPTDSDQFVFYDKCLKPADIVYFGGVLLEEGKHRWSVLGIHRALQSQPYTDDELTVLARLGTHLRRALQIHRQLSVVQHENQELYKLLDCLNVGVMILDQQKCIRYSNLNATKILEKSALLYPNQFNHLKTNTRFQAQLDQYIDSALYQQKSVNVIDCGGVLGLYENEQDHPLMLTVVPLSKMPQWGVHHIAQPHVVVFLTERSQQRQLAKQFMHNTYDLSKRELQLCELFLNGLELDEIAQHCDISIQSVRTYFKNIFSKTHCNGQVELIRLLNGLTLDFEHIV